MKTVKIITAALALSLAAVCVQAHAAPERQTAARAEEDFRPAAENDIIDIANALLRLGG